MVNFKIFRGEHVLDLEPKAYAIHAELEGDAGRSNYLGKTSLCAAVDFALFGRLEREFAGRKRDWVSRGEKGGEVELVLSDGSAIKRSQGSGAERLYYYPPGDPERGAVQDEAQKRVDALVGLSREDFVSTRYFRQGEMSRLLTLDPGPRLDLVAGWLGLGALQGCEDDAADALAEVARRREGKRSEAESARGNAEGILRLAGAATDLELAGRVNEAMATLENASLALREAEYALEEARELDQARERALEYDRAVEEGKRISDEIRDSFLKNLPVSPEGWKLGRDAFRSIREGLECEVGETVANLRAAAERSGILSEEKRARRTVATGRFDGVCPLLGEECPAKAHVGRRGKELREVFVAAEEQATVAGLAVQDAEEERVRATRELAAFDERTRRVIELREAARRLKPARDRWEALSARSEGSAAARERAREAREAHAAAVRDADRLERAREQVLECRKRERAAEDEASSLDAAVRVASRAAAIFGKSGAQRRMAEGELAGIEAEANRMLAVAGIDLQLEVRWSREGAGAASTCAACGEAFPRSEKVKSCARCGAPRGKNVVAKLEVEPSRQSGGARDLAGIFLQLAAAAWLVEERGARWATAMLDEPLAALDASYRRALSSRLPEILRETGVEQAFVIGHDRGALESLPGRIKIVSHDGWSAASVAA